MESESLYKKMMTLQAEILSLDNKDKDLFIEKYRTDLHRHLFETLQALDYASSSERGDVITLRKKEELVRITDIVDAASLTYKQVVEDEAKKESQALIEEVYLLALTRLENITECRFQALDDLKELIRKYPLRYGSTALDFFSLEKEIQRCNTNAELMVCLKQYARDRFYLEDSLKIFAKKSWADIHLVSKECFGLIKSRSKKWLDSLCTPYHSQLPQEKREVHEAMQNLCGCVCQFFGENHASQKEDVREYLLSLLPEEYREYVIALYAAESIYSYPEIINTFLSKENSEQEGKSKKPSRKRKPKDSN